VCGEVLGIMVAGHCHNCCCQRSLNMHVPVTFVQATPFFSPLLFRVGVPFLHHLLICFWVWDLNLIIGSSLYFIEILVNYKLKMLSTYEVISSLLSWELN
jgi:hypothetical protein